MTHETIHARLESAPQDPRLPVSDELHIFSPAQLSGWLVRTRLGAILPHDDRVARMLAAYGATMHDRAATETLSETK